MLKPAHILRSEWRIFVAAMTAMLLPLAFIPTAAWSQAAQQPELQQPLQPQSPQQQKSIVIQVAPAPATQPPPAPATLAPAPMAQQAPPPVERENPGLINEFNKLFTGKASLMPSWSLPSLGSGNLNTVVKGRVVCPVAANGAPDCKVASDKLCQSKGYKEGNSLDTDAAQTCSPKAMIPGRQPEPGDCRTDNYVTQAVCK
ncbi:MAG: hypothetical protein ABWY10_04635 [Tardiphaga sp.]